VDADHYDLCMATLTDLHHTVETDRLPVRVELVASGGRWVDVHPVRFDGRGPGVQGDLEGTHFLYPPTAFAVGRLGGRTVSCLSARQQEVFHSGYEPRPHDEHDVSQLARLREAGRPRPSTGRYGPTRGLQAPEPLTGP
jgi:lincosamide nucleotidyltransferase A/C/D/E